MTKEEFIRVIRQVVRDASISGCREILRSPSGRSPDPHLLALSEWFNQLPEDHQQKTVASMKMATDLAIFGFLCVLDGVRQIETDSEKGKLVLEFVKHGRSVVLNEASGHDLHDLFKMETAGQ